MSSFDQDFHRKFSSAALPDLKGHLTGRSYQWPYHTEDYNVRAVLQATAASDHELFTHLEWKTVPSGREERRNFWIFRKSAGLLVSLMEHRWNMIMSAGVYNTKVYTRCIRPQQSPSCALPGLPLRTGLDIYQMRHQCLFYNRCRNINHISTENAYWGLLFFPKMTFTNLGQLRRKIGPEFRIQSTLNRINCGNRHHRFPPAIPSHYGACARAKKWRRFPGDKQHMTVIDHPWQAGFRVGCGDVKRKSPISGVRGGLPTFQGLLICVPSALWFCMPWNRYGIKQFPS